MYSLEQLSNIVHCVDLINDYEAVNTPLTNQHIRAQQCVPPRQTEVTLFEEVVDTPGSIR